MSELKIDGATSAQCYIHQPVRFQSISPVSFRLGKLHTGELVLQGSYPWQEGDIRGIDWKTIPTVNLDSNGDEC